MPTDPNADLILFRPLDGLPLWAVAILIIVLLVSATEFGYRLSKYTQRRGAGKTESIVGSLNGATLALLAFLLAFVVGASVTSLSSRRQAVVNEANAIGTTGLRAGLLPEAYVSQSRQLLAEYTDLRLVEPDERQQILEIIARSEAIHGELWALAEAAAAESPTPITAGYITSLNQMIDLHAERVNAELVARLPTGVFVLLLLIAFLALIILGLHAGYAEKRTPFALAAFVLALTVVFMLIIDMSRGQQGMLQVSQQAFVDLLRTVGGG